MKKTNRLYSVLSLLLVVVFVMSSIAVLPASAADNESKDVNWKIDLGTGTDASAIPSTDDYKIEAQGTSLGQFDGANCLSFNHNAFFINDAQNQLVKCKTFFVDYKVYFEEFPVGERDNLTADQYPISIFTWIVENNYTRSIRIDGKGNLFYDRYTDKAIGAKLELKTWHNLRFAITPETGAFEIYLDNQLVFSKNYSSLFETTKSRIRFFDTAYQYKAYVKDISIYSDNAYSIIVGANEEPTSNYIGYQTSKTANGTFDIRFLSGLEKLDGFNAAGYNIYVVSMDEDGTVSEKETTHTFTKVTQAITADGKNVAAKDLETEYLSLFTLEDIDTSAKSTMIVVRPFTYVNDLKKYGEAKTLYYTGNEEGGYPVLTDTPALTEIFTGIPASDDTYIQKAKQDTVLGESNLIEVKFNGEGAGNTRSAFFKFTIPKDVENTLLNSEKIYLKLNISSTRNPSAAEMAGNGIVAQVRAVNNDWDELSLTYRKAETTIKTGQKVGELYFSGAGEALADITQYVIDCLLDNQYTISLRVDNVVDDGSNGPTVITAKEGNPEQVAKITIDDNNDKMVYNHTLNLDKASNYGYEPWGYAEKLVDEWFNGGKDKVYAADNNEVFELDAVDTSKPTGAYTVRTDGRSTGNPPSGTYRELYARTLASLAADGYEPSTDADKSQYDLYGGITNAGIKGQATGFFHVEILNGRHYIIDPLGNPFFAVGMNSINAGTTQNQKNVMLQKFGSEENYWKEMTKSLREVGVNSAAGASGQIYESETPLSGIVGISGIGGYMRDLGLSISTGGSSAFAYNDTMNIFDPDFQTFVDTRNAATLTNYASNDKIIGYTSDNELPKVTTILMNYLTLDPTIPYNAFSYATAWTWLAEKSGNPNPSLDDVKGEYYEEFKAFMYGKLFETCAKVIDKYDPNHMYVGTRADSSNKTSEGYLRAAGAYCDLLTINMYDGLQPSVKTMATIYRYSGKPFIVTEFYAKAEDAYDMNGQLLANQQNAGWLVRTQEDRASYYENYTLLLLESKYCVGWIWYRFQDNDQSLYTRDDGKTLLRVWQKGDRYEIVSYIDDKGVVSKATGTEVQWYSGETDTSNLGSNKGIADNEMNLYKPLSDAITRINDNLFNLISYFDSLH